MAKSENKKRDRIHSTNELSDDAKAMSQEAFIALPSEQYIELYEYDGATLVAAK